MVKVQEMGLPRDSLERRRGGRGGPAPRRDRREDGERVPKRINNDYNTNFKSGGGRVDKKGGENTPQHRKRTGFNPMSKAHMGSDAYKGHGMTCNPPSSPCPSPTCPIHSPPTKGYAFGYRIEG